MGDQIPLAPLDDSQRRGKSVAPHAATPPRRGFIYNLLAATVGGLAGLAPVAAGLAVFFDPLRRKKGAGGMIPVATLTSLPDASKGDALIGRFPVITDRDDAWNHYPKEPVGSVYLVVPKGTTEIRALQATCPHLGCAVDVQQAEGQTIFRCPCHTSSFELDGKRILPCVSPRDMDDLPIEVRDVGGRKEVSVHFMKFQPGLTEKKVKA